MANYVVAYEMVQQFEVIVEAENAVAAQKIVESDVWWEGLYHETDSEIVSDSFIGVNGVSPLVTGKTTVQLHSTPQGVPEMGD